MLVALAILVACDDPESPGSLVEASRALSKLQKAAAARERDGGLQYNVDDENDIEYSGPTAMQCRESAETEAAVGRAEAMMRRSDYRGAATELRNHQQPAGQPFMTPGTARAGFLIARLDWIVSVADALRVSRVRLLGRPRRVYAKSTGRLSGSLPPHVTTVPLQDDVLEGDPLDVWAEHRGWLLVAFPDLVPSFVVGDLSALAGWIPRSETLARPTRERVLDTGRPLPIKRPDARGRIALHGQQRAGVPCRVCEYTGVVVETALGATCRPLDDVCGGPGLTDEEPQDVDIADQSARSCEGCAASERTFKKVGDYCRAAEPGWTWQCAPGSTTLVCSPPGDRRAGPS